MGGKKWKSFMAKLYGFGAAIVIIGAMFKIMHWPGAGPMLVVGLSTEAVIFFFSAFEPPHEEVDWSLVYPELAGMHGEEADKLIEDKGSLTEQLRFRNDVTRINLLLSDIGFDYSVNKKLKVGFHYRFIKSNRGNYYSSRHRISADITWKEKIDFITITLRERIQEQFSDYYSIETGNIPVWVLRSKLTVKFDINKKYSPYLSGEIYYLLDNAVNAKGITRFRYETGINYDFNRVHSINPFIICQVARPVNFIELIYGISYTYSF